MESRAPAGNTSPAHGHTEVPDQNEPANAGTPRTWHDHPALHLVVLYSISAYWIVMSWLRWPDPVVDFGRELYIAWRLSEGAVLYRDLDDLYGPLSQYFNGLVFRVFGPGLIVLALVNLILFGVIVAALYSLVRRAWSSKTALLAVAVFITVFGFSRFTFGGNFNYATPYAHETTHGILILLLLVMTLSRWVEAPSTSLSLVGGLLVGATFVLKPEIILPGVAVCAAALAMFVRQQRTVERRWLVISIVGAALPTLFFFLLLLPSGGPVDAAAGAGHAWLFASRHIVSAVQLRYSGLDAPWAHAWGQFCAAGLAAAVLAGIIVIARIYEQYRTKTWSIPLLSLVLVAVACASWQISIARWLEVGKCFPGLILLYLCFLVYMVYSARGKHDVLVRLQQRQLLLVLLAGTLLLRMILNSRIYHYGFYQAALAAVVILAAAVFELPARVCRTAAGRRAAAAGVLAFLIPGILGLGNLSVRNNRDATLPISEGRDRFYASPSANSIARLVADLQQSIPRGQTLVVLPDGLMINYQARLLTPVATNFFHSANTENGREMRVVAELAAHPPDWLVTVPLNLSEYGIERYGDRPGNGAAILAWAATHYVDPDPPYRPFSYSTKYVQLYKRKH